MELPMTSPAKRLALAVAVILVTAAACVIYRHFDPEEHVLWPKCIFHLLTGLECPGCGSQRAIHSLLNGEVIKAMHYNLLMVFLLPYLFFFGLLQLFTAKSQNARLKRFCCKAELLLYRGRAIRLISVLIIVFWIVRNLSPDF